MNKVTLIDYSVGNLFSVASAIEKCGASVRLSNSANDIENAERLILPGVGAFRDGMSGLKQSSLIEPIKRFIETGRPFMGICLGMQMMLDVSDEFGTFDGLSLIPGRVISIPNTTKDGLKHKIPHIGWGGLFPNQDRKDWKETILENIEPGENVYFLHSYHALTEDSNNTLANCDYNGRELSAVIFSENIYGCQFHPEKSGPVGLKIMDSFCNSISI